MRQINIIYSGHYITDRGGYWTIDYGKKRFHSITSAITWIVGNL